MMRYIVDSNIWIKLLQRKRAVRSHLAEAMERGDEIVVTPVVYYEVLRGLHKRNDQESIRFLTALWDEYLYVEISRNIWDEAIRLWVMAVKKNEQRGDADTLIAACASRLGGTVVTDDEEHFITFSVPVENWAA